ncbi:MAG: methylated-DNA-protein-cysteine methyltransferase-like protein [Candidatus Promineifilaceae bacterium]|jgi:methylated-DNA-protein-cysteine methyltransferase-like protein
MKSYFDQVYAVVRLIPPGKVTAYGRIARMLGRPQAARAVGYALNGLKGSPEHSDVPWWRVVNAAGQISIGNREASANKQAEILRSEGVEVSEGLSISLSKYLWEGADIFLLDEIIHSE